jgi:3-hydroxy-9,10-secoandrosta-1,3,5(10)-triene-9,17-dione monooxygenase reductase component
LIYGRAIVNLVAALPNLMRENMKNTGEFDSREFRNALGNFATGVTVITAKDLETGYVGTTASSFNSVSIDPPLVLWSLDKSARSLRAYETAEHFVVNVLAADQVSLSNEFARPDDDKFNGVEYQLNGYGVPVLAGCVAHFECSTKYLYEGGDHVIIVGEVLAFEYLERNALLFHQGGYCVSEYHPITKKRSSPTAKDEAFSDDYINYLVGRAFYQLREKLKPLLNKYGISSVEYRVLASLAGREDCSFKVLLHYTLLDEAALQSALQLLAEKGLIVAQELNDAYFETTLIALTEAGIQKAEPLLKVAYAHEADAMGNFNREEARQLKEYLKRMVAWTA